jgi:hypothetical protein
MSKIKFSYGSTELVFASSIVYPVTMPRQIGQAMIPLAGGGERIETVGRHDTQEFPLVWNYISLPEINAMLNWFDSVVSWAVRVFTYHDPVGSQHNVRWLLPQAWDPQWVDYNRYSLSIRLKKVTV